MDYMYIGTPGPVCADAAAGKRLAEKLLPLLHLANRAKDKSKLKIRIDFEGAFLFTIDFFEAAFSRVPDVTTRETFEQVVDLYELPPAGRLMLEYVLDRAERAERHPIRFEEKKELRSLLFLFDREAALAKKSRRQKRKRKKEPRLLYFVSHSARLYLEVARKSDYFLIQHLLRERGIRFVPVFSCVPLETVPEEILGGRITGSLEEFLEAHQAPAVTAEIGETN